MSWIEVIKPERFDGNEIYSICLAFLTFGTLFYLQKRYKCLYMTELLFLWATDHVLGIIGDYILALPPLDLYDTFDQADADVGDILLHNINYPFLVISFVCIYALTKAKGLNKLLVIMLGAVTGVIVEFIGVEFFNLFLYKRWNTFFSFLFYLVVFHSNFFIYDKVHQYIDKKRQSLKS